MTPIALRFGSNEEFERARDLFVGAGFSDTRLRELGVADFESVSQYTPESEPLTLFDALYRLFLGAGMVVCADLEQLADVADLLALGLLQREGDTYRATVRVRPCLDVYVASDFWTPDDTRDDVVMPPDSVDTRRYLGFLPAVACERFLEACGGSGVAALMAAKKWARQAWAVDISERSVVFANFSARLNGLENFTAIAGDTFQAVEGLTFDRIVAHPPFIAVHKHTWLFHDGGADGESITRRHVEGLARVLAPGGRFYCRCMAAERVDSTFEQRVRNWLGAAASEFDLAVFDLPPSDPIHVLVRSAVRRNMDGEEIDECIRKYRALKLKAFQMVYWVAQRHGAAREPFTIRYRRTPRNHLAHLEWAMRWAAMTAEQAADAILGGKLRTGEVRLHQTSVFRKGWSTEAMRMEVRDPFPLTWDVDELTVYLLPKLIGTQTGAMMYRLLTKEGVMGHGGGQRLFAGVLAQLISGGFIILEGHEPPPPVDHQDAEG